MQENKIAIVGAGKMGRAMLTAIQTQFKNVNAFDKETDLSTALPIADIVIFAVKPQDFSSINVNLSGKLVLSIMAGITIEKIKQQTKAMQVVRSMPNLPLQVQYGLTAWLASPEVEEKDTVRKIFKTFGHEIELNKEEEIDKITALSGSGPAYFIRFCELMQEKAEEMGFAPEDAKKIAETTFIGAAHWLESSPKPARILREEVTSKGGTTEAALNKMEETKIGENFKASIDAAKTKAKELNN